MKFTFILGENKTPIEKLNITQNATLLLGDGYLPPINLDDELVGVSNFIKALCLLSKKSNGLILGACKIFCKSKIFWGTIVVDKGKFLGIADMNHSIDDTFNESNSTRVFDTTCGRLGIVSGDDIYYPETSRILRLWECDMLVYAVRGRLTHNHRTLIDANAITNGVTAIGFSTDTFYSSYTKNAIKKGNDLYVVAKSSDLLLSHRKPESYSELIKRFSL